METLHGIRATSQLLGSNLPVFDSSAFARKTSKLILELLETNFNFRRCTVGRKWVATRWTRISWNDVVWHSKFFYGELRVIRLFATMNNFLDFCSKTKDGGIRVKTLVIRIFIIFGFNYFFRVFANDGI